MKAKQARILAAVLLVVACGVATLGYLVWSTFSHTDDQAIAQMNAEERELLARIERVHSRMNAEQVYEILGEPTTDLFLVAKWEGAGGSRFSELRMYYFDGRPRRIRWLKLGYFMYEKDL